MVQEFCWKFSCFKFFELYKRPQMENDKK